jgi:hypothetical protein
MDTLPTNTTTVTPRCARSNRTPSAVLATYFRALTPPLPYILRQVMVLG